MYFVFIKKRDNYIFLRFWFSLFLFIYFRNTLDRKFSIHKNLTESCSMKYVCWSVFSFWNKILSKFAQHFGNIIFEIAFIYTFFILHNIFYYTSRKSDSFFFLLSSNLIFYLGLFDGQSVCIILIKNITLLF